MSFVDLDAESGRPSVLRGDIDVKQCMETLQDAYIHAVTAAARCSLAKPNRDRGIDWIVSHQSASHTADFQADLRVQLKSTYQIAQDDLGKDFPITIRNDRLERLTRTPVTQSSILVAMIVPRDIEEWIAVADSHLAIRHCAYWVNLEGHPVTGDRKTTVRVPTSQVFNVEAVCAIMERIGKGGKA